MWAKVFAVLAALAKAYLLWDEERIKQLGAKQVEDKLKKDQDEKIKNANVASAGELSDELLISPKDRGKG